MNKQTRKSQIYPFIYLNKKLICFITLAYNFKKLITFQIKQHKQIFQSIFHKIQTTEYILLHCTNISNLTHNDWDISIYERKCI